MEVTVISLKRNLSLSFIYLFFSGDNIPGRLLMRGIALTSLPPLPKQTKHAKAVTRDAGEVGQKLRNLSFASKIQSRAVCWVKFGQYKANWKCVGTDNDHFWSEKRERKKRCVAAFAKGEQNSNKLRDKMEFGEKQNRFLRAP